LLALAEQQTRGETEPLGDLVERLLLDEIRAQPGEIAFGKLAELPVEQRGHCTIQHRVAEKLQPLVVGLPEAAVRERLAQQAGIAKAMTECLLQAVEVHGRLANGAQARHQGRLLP
jgi:hypothetical protein